MAASDSGNKVKLFIKPSYVRKHENTPGCCPICQEWFMTLYCMKDMGLFQLSAVIVSDIPSDEWKNLGVSKPPAIWMEAGEVDGESFSSYPYTDLEEFLALWSKPFFIPPIPSKYNPSDYAGHIKVENEFRSLYSAFNNYLRDKNDNDTHLRKEFQKLEDYLNKECTTNFLQDDRMSYSDCVLIPKLHHIRIAAEHYKGLTLEKYPAIRRYLSRVYNEDAFRDSCPYDEDIIAHYEKKASCKPRGDPNKYHCGEVHKTMTIDDSGENGEFDEYVEEGEDQ